MPSAYHKWTARLLGQIRFYNPGRAIQSVRRKINFRGSFDFENRSQGHKRLIIIIAGHKPMWWDLVLPRIHQYAPTNADICVAAPGADNGQLRSWCRSHGWSYLHTNANRLALASNLAIKNHPNAEIILKTDEDMFFPEFFFEDLESVLEKACVDGIFDPGFVCPTINVNGYSYRILLEQMGKLEEYRSLFGDFRSSCTDNAAWRSPDAAKYLWAICGPFDESARKLRAQPPAYSACPHRFNIGCILFRRELWAAMDGFTVSGDGYLGVEESDWCSWCFDNSKAIIVSHNILVGHGGFSNQMAELAPILREREDLKFPTGT
jgi:hypothetical protein